MQVAEQGLSAVFAEGYCKRSGLCIGCHLLLFMACLCHHHTQSESDFFLEEQSVPLQPHQHIAGVVPQIIASMLETADVAPSPASEVSGNYILFRRCAADIVSCQSHHHSC